MKRIRTEYMMEMTLVSNYDLEKIALAYDLDSDLEEAPLGDALSDNMNHEESNLNKNMMRLADYFVVVEYSTDPQKGGLGRGHISQRFPVKDWDDVPFTSEIELFCQPQGWTLSSERLEPKFFVSVLTHMNGNRHYCACLSFHEPIAITPSKPIDEEEETESSGDSIGRSFSSPLNSRSSSTHLTLMYAPKCLVIMSRLYQIEAFRQCLGTIYTVHSETMGVSLEVLVGNLLGHILVPPAGGPQIRYSLGGGDRLAFQPPVNSSIPVTNSTVAQLFQQLGINNVLVLFCAVMTEQKILFHSKSINRLTDACHALTSLMFPFRYSHVYVPLLPSSITEVACSPTPFIIGVHSSARNECTDMMDVIVADLDGGSITVPDGISIPTLPESLWSHIQELLSMVLHPELSSADFAFPPLAVKPSIQNQLDKEIRAIFMRMFAQLFQGYRSCLVIIRIHPKPVITFHKAKFLGQRGLVDTEFVVKLLDCMFFNQFILERGSPWRPCDLWDEHYSNLPDQLRAEAVDTKLVMQHIQQLAELLGYNENPNPQQYVPKIIKPPEGAHTRIHTPVFPILDTGLVQQVIQEGMAKQPLNRYNVSAKNQPRIVPIGPKVMELLDLRCGMVDNSARRLEVLRNCVTCIFENKISDAKKSIHAVTRALKSQAAKLVLCEELSQHVTGNKAMLESQQFDMIVKLMHCALQDNSVMDEHGVAAALLPLATSFCRKLCTGVIQFAYTCIQEHPVWKNQQFWESTFYTDVQKDIKSLYIPRIESSLHNNNYSVINDNVKRANDNNVVFNKHVECTALEIAAEQMRLLPSPPQDSGDGKVWPSYLTERLKDFVKKEESTLYSQAIHYANRMVYMLVPLDTPARRYKEVNHIDEERGSNITSMGESDSVGGESGFEEPDPMVESVTNVVRLISRFVDKVCTEGGVSEDHIRTLHSMIPGVVDMHVETLEAVHRESKRLPPVQKPKIPLPALLPGEELVMECLRVYLLPDGREDGTGGSMGGPILLPVEGAIFFSNYRLIFKGSPCDPYAAEQVVIRSFPVASLTKEKRITVQYLAHLDQLLQEGLQLRSATFQLLKLAFDEEVSSESIEVFRKLLHKFRHPNDIFSYFAFTGHTLSAPAPLHSIKDKNTTLRNIAKKTLMMTAKKAGLKPKQSKRQKYVLMNWPQGNGGTLPPNTKYLTGAGSPLKHSPPSRENIDGDDVSLSDDEFPHPALSNLSSQSDAKNLERMKERSYYKDWTRLGLGSITKSATNTMGAAYLNKAESFRISFVNSTYFICRSYPALLVVPNLISEDSVKKVGRCYRGNRFPVITWKHPRTRALLVRGASFNSKGLMAFLKGNPHPGVSGGGVSEAAAHVEQENFIRAIVNATPLAVVKQGSAWAMSESTLSLDSLYTSATGIGHGHHQHHHHNSHHLNPESHAALASQITPEIGRKSNPFMKAMNTLRYAGTSGGKGMKYTGWTVSRPKKNPPPSQTAVAFKNVPKLATESELIASDGLVRLHRAALYVFGEKSQIKGIKTEPNSKVEYIPVDFSDVRHVRTAFKKLMRACIPSNSVTDPENGFLKSVEGTEWLQQLSNIMQLAGAVVDLIDVQGSSVMLCLEDGSDVTTQVVSIAQICLDPYYRTFEGFQTLIEKEWLGFGHRFAHRNNMTGVEGPSSNPGFAPIFLQFLDVIHQILKQFPLAFEFNQYYIKFLAYHSVSARFRTFLVDNEMERVELGFMALEDKRGSLPRHYNRVDTGSDDESIYLSKSVGSNSHQHLGQSIFEYIEKQHAKWPIFYNFSYDKDCDIQILRPMNNLPNLEIWDYYINETLGLGASFDFETSLVDIHINEDNVPSETDKDTRSCVMAGYDLVENHIPDAFSYNLQKFHQWEADKCMLPQKWKQVWDKLEVPINEDSAFTRQASIVTQMVRQIGRSVHKRSTVDILVRGKQVRSTDFSSVYPHSHRFEKHTFTTLTNCDNCSTILLGKSGFKCGDCGVKCHEKCSEGVPKCGAKYPKGNSDNMINSGSPHTNSVIENNSSVSSGPSLQSSHQNFQYDQFPSTMPTENRTHEGYLYKRGALLKGWKQRWFVLDSIKHQLRYYDAMEDSNYKGFIELADVDNVTPASPSPGAPKKTDDKSFFDIRTNKRVYNFCASDAITAQEWIEKIQACLQ